MKTSLLLILFIFTSIQSQTMGQDPPAQTPRPAFTSSEGSLKTIEITVEWVQIKEAEATTLLHYDDRPGNSSKWRKYLQELVKTGTGKVAASASLSTYSYQPTSTELWYNHIYLSGYHTGKALHASSVQELTMQPVGIRFEVDPTVSNSDVISLNIAPEWTMYLGDAPSPIDRQPKIYTLKIQTTVSLQSGGSIPIGIMCPPGAKRTA